MLILSDLFIFTFLDLRFSSSHDPITILRSTIFPYFIPTIIKSIVELRNCMSICFVIHVFHSTSVWTANWSDCEVLFIVVRRCEAGVFVFSYYFAIYMLTLLKNLSFVKFRLDFKWLLVTPYVVLFIFWSLLHFILIIIFVIVTFFRWF